MTTKELRNEWCKNKGFNYIDFETIRQAEEYILFLEERIEQLTMHNVVCQREQLPKCEHKNISREDGLDECLDCGVRNY